METNGERGRLSPEEARAALDDAHAAEDVVRHPVLPGWFFPAMAAVLAALLLGQMLSEEQRTTISLGSVAVALLLNYLAHRQSGASWVTYRLRDMAPMLGTLLVIIFGAAIAAEVTGDEWYWAIGAGASVVVVLVTGFLYNRAVAHRSGDR